MNTRQVSWLTVAFALAVLLIGVATTPDIARAGVLLSDDFNDGVIDTSKWWPRTDTYGGANVQETGGVLQMIGRGYLNTLSQYNPVTDNGLHITGTWTFTNVGGDLDMLQIITRSSGAPGGSYGETTDGIEFYINNGAAQPSIQKPGGMGSFSFSDIIKSGSVDISQGDTLSFDIYDYGDNRLSFTVTEIAGAHVGQSATVTATVSGGTATSNYITFHNRESASRTASLDNVLIETLGTFWTGATSSDWGDPTNWSPEGVPTSAAFGMTLSGASVDLVDLGTDSRTLEALSFQKRDRHHHQQQPGFPFDSE